MKDTSWLTSTRFAHRGLHDNVLIPENSLLAFDNAVKHGYGIEFDVYLTNDGRLIVHHDYSLYRTCHMKCNAKQVDTSKLSDYKLFNTKESIPLLSEVLNLVDGKVPLILEIKTSNDVVPTCKAIYDMIEDYKGPIAVESFDTRMVNWWSKYHPEFVVGQLYSTIWLERLYTKCTKQYKKVDFLAVSCKNILDKYFKKIKAKHPEKLIINWTVKLPEHQYVALRYADNYIFECSEKNSNYVSLKSVDLLPNTKEHLFEK